MSNKRFVRLPAIMACFFITSLLLASSVLRAQDGYVAVTNKNLNVEVEDLTLMLLPLSKQQLEIEATAWHSALTDTLHRVTTLEIQSKQLGRKAQLLEDAADEVEDEQVRAQCR